MFGRLVKEKKYQAIVAALIGNILEVYDFSIYGYFASSIANQIFPSSQQWEGLFGVYALFFVGFLARPLGALFFGRIGDKRGRKIALSLSVLAIALSTTLIGLLPPRQWIGASAPLLLLVLRLIQGFSLGGEYTGSVIFMVEHAQHHRRTLAGSIAMIGGNVGTLLASLVAWLLGAFLPMKGLMGHGWRLAFYLALLGGIVGFVLRIKLPETAVFLAQSSQKKSIRRVVLNYWKEYVLIALLTWLGVIVTYFVFVYAKTWLSIGLHFSSQQVLALISCSLLVVILTIPLTAILADCYGRKKLLGVAIAGIAILLIFYLKAISLGDWYFIILMQLLIAIPCGMYFAIAPVIIAELLPVSIRYTGSAFVYNLSAALFGGSVPLLASFLLAKRYAFVCLASYFLLVCLLLVCMLFRWQSALRYE